MNPGKLLILAALAVLTARLPASQIMYGTGVDANNNDLPGGSMDPHYTIMGPGFPLQQAIVESPGNHCTITTGCFTVQWVPGQWDSSNDSTSNACCGVYDFTTTLDLTGYSSFQGVLVSLAWTADDIGGDILINGVDQPNTDPGYGNWGSLTRFSILGSNTALKYSSINTIVFPVSFTDVATNGFTVQILPLPEPATFLLLGGALISLGVLAVISKFDYRSMRQRPLAHGAGSGRIAHCRPTEAQHQLPPTPNFCLMGCRPASINSADSAHECQ